MCIETFEKFYHLQIDDQIIDPVKRALWLLESTLTFNPYLIYRLEQSPDIWRFHYKACSTIMFVVILYMLLTLYNLSWRDVISLLSVLPLTDCYFIIVKSSACCPYISVIILAHIYINLTICLCSTLLVIRTTTSPIQDGDNLMITKVRL